MQSGLRAAAVAVCLAASCVAAGAWAGVIEPARLQAGSPVQGDPARVAEAPPPAARAITLAPHVTELLFAAGAGDKIVGTVSSSDFPARAKTIPRVGDGMNANVEKTLALRPDVAIAWLPSGAAQTLAPSLSRLGIPLLYSRPLTLDDIPEQILRFGKLFATGDTALLAASALDARIKALRADHARSEPVGVFIEIGASPLYTIGKDPLLNDALHACGGVNVYADTAIAAPQISIESVLVKQPKVVIAPTTSAGRLEEVRQRWAALHLPAALRSHVYGIDPDALFRPGPRLIDAVEELCAHLDQSRLTP
jgi:vitamin B12 transport system substrate-binding protein